MTAIASIRPVSPFAVATIAPIPLLALGGLFGGIFIFAALLYMTILTMVLDGMFRTASGDAAAGAEWPQADKLSQGLAMAHFPLLIIGILAVQGQTVGGWSGFAALLAFGMFFGQVSNSNAHELIHRTDKTSFNLGKWVLISLLYGHHVTAHRHIHHRFVGTPEDPNSAALGESFWSFFPRAWGDAFMAGWDIENYMAESSGKELPFWRHPYTEYVGGAVLIMLLVVFVFGFSGLLAYILLALYAQLQLLLSDYVQHYGLRRRKFEEEDEYEPVAPWHSWNSVHWFSSGLMLNAPRHSDHHMHPSRPYPELGLPDHMEGPRLPYSLPVMAAIALVPPSWFKLMDRRAVAWQERIDAGEIKRSEIPMPTRSSEQITPRATAVTTQDDDDITGRVGAAMAGEGVREELEEVSIDPDAAEERGVGLRRASALTAKLNENGSRRRRRPEGNADDAVPASEETSNDVDPLAGLNLSNTDEQTASDEAPSSFLWNDPDDTAGPGIDETQPYNEDQSVDIDLPEDASEEDQLAAALRAAGVEASTEVPLTEGEDEDIADIEEDEDEEEPVNIDNAVAGVMADVRKAERRKRAGKFPALEPADVDDEPTPAKHELSANVSVLRGAGIAARGLAALMRGAPPQPADKNMSPPVEMDEE